MAGPAISPGLVVSFQPGAGVAADPTTDATADGVTGAGVTGAGVTAAGAGVNAGTVGGGVIEPPPVVDGITLERNGGGVPRTVFFSVSPTLARSYHAGRGRSHPARFGRPAAGLPYG